VCGAVPSSNANVREEEKWKKPKWYGAPKWHNSNSFKVSMQSRQKNCCSSSSKQGGMVRPQCPLSNAKASKCTRKRQAHCAAGVANVALLQWLKQTIEKNLKINLCGMMQQWWHPQVIWKHLNAAETRIRSLASEQEQKTKTTINLCGWHPPSNAKPFKCTRKS